MTPKPQASLLRTKVKECQPQQWQRRHTNPDDVLCAARAQLMDAQIRHLQDVFTLFDEAGSGHINQRDLRLAMQTLGIWATENEILLVMEWQGIGGKRINFGDFLVMMFSLFQDHRIEDQLREIFDLFDKDRDGYLNADELAAALVRHGTFSMSDVEVFAILEDCGTDPDGRGISFENFVHYMCRAEA